MPQCPRPSPPRPQRVSRTWNVPGPFRLGTRRRRSESTWKSAGLENGGGGNRTGPPRSSEKRVDFIGPWDGDAYWDLPSRTTRASPRDEAHGPIQPWRDGRFDSFPSPPKLRFLLSSDAGHYSQLLNWQISERWLLGKDVPKMFRRVAARTPYVPPVSSTRNRSRGRVAPRSPTPRRDRVPSGRASLPSGGRRLRARHDERGGRRVPGGSHERPTVRLLAWFSMGRRSQVPSRSPAVRAAPS